MKDTRERLLEAAEQILRQRGLSHLSTREVAREAGVADGALYHHFADKNELLVAVISRESPKYFDAFRNLPLQVGQRTVDENLKDVAWVFYEFQRHAIPITCSLFADMELLEKHRQLLRANKVGPTRIYDALTAYLGAEQRLGRVSGAAELASVATVIVGGCFQVAFLETHWGMRQSRAQARQKTDGVIDALMRGL